ncbi:MAG: EF-hand domain-containing protein [Candidatus Sericytochromatia bacterium]|nr:EF-hand domain-containing protein [Candidatus Sericytochromatia bacterium]
MLRRLGCCAGLMIVLGGCGQSVPAATGVPGEAVTSLSRTGLQQASALLAQDMLRRLDRDGDGWVNREEWVQGGMDPNEFKKLDLSRQARLGLNDLLRTQGFADFRRKVNEVVTNLMGRLDSDKDGALGRSEFLEGLARGVVDPVSTGLSMTAFDLADRNYDAKLVVSEVENMVAFSVVEAQLAAQAPKVPPTSPVASASVR